MVAIGESETTYLPVPLEGLAAREPLPFPLYLETSPGQWVLYRDARTDMTSEQLERLQAEGVPGLFIRRSDQESYCRRVEESLDGILKDAAVPLSRRADVLHGVAVAMAGDLLRARPDRPALRRAERVMLAMGGLLLRERGAFAAVRRLMGASTGLANHGLTVGFLSMGLSRHVLGAEPGLLAMAGLAGLLHDVGRIDHEHLDPDPEHTIRGHDYLKLQQLPVAVCEAALYHHERFDGSGYPRGLSGEEIPELARVVGMVDTFDKVYSGQQARVGVFDALRIMAKAYRGCFEERLAAGFVRLFRQ